MLVTCQFHQASFFSGFLLFDSCIYFKYFTSISLLGPSSSLSDRYIYLQDKETQRKRIFSPLKEAAKASHNQPAMPTLNISELNIVLSVLGAFILLYGFISVKIKDKWLLGEARMSRLPTNWSLNLSLSLSASSSLILD